MTYDVRLKIIKLHIINLYNKVYIILKINKFNIFQEKINMFFLLVNESNISYSIISCEFMQTENSLFFFIMNEIYDIEYHNVNL